MLQITDIDDQRDPVTIGDLRVQSGKGRFKTKQNSADHEISGVKESLPWRSFKHRRA
jgi:hypothetical protein